MYHSITGYCAFGYLENQVVFEFWHHLYRKDRIVNTSLVSKWRLARCVAILRRQYDTQVIDGIMLLNRSGKNYFTVSHNMLVDRWGNIVAVAGYERIG